MVGGGDCKVATVEVEASAAGDNTATLPVTRPMNPQQEGISQDNAEKNNAANKEMELKNVRSTPAKKTSLFIIMSFIYAKLLVVICITYVISEVITHKLPLYYYEGFFTYLYGISILFLLYVFCFLLQESSCCSKGTDTPTVPSTSGQQQPQAKPSKPSKEDKKEKKEKKDKDKEQKDKEKKEKKEKEKKDKKDKKDKDKGKDKDKDKDKSKEEEKDKKEFQEATDIEAQVVPARQRKRKTSQSDSSHGSFFLRIGAIAFGLGTMVYNGLEFGVFFEVPPTSPCYQILQGVNPVLQMIFTFMQMYFIFMNSRLNIHRFKVIARFGLMHVVATNICVWIRTLVYESIKEISLYHRRKSLEDAGILSNIRGSLRNPAIPGLDRDLSELRLSNQNRGKVGRTLPTTLASVTQAAHKTISQAFTTGATVIKENLSTSAPSSSVPSISTTSTTIGPVSPSNAGTTLSDYLTTLMSTSPAASESSINPSASPDSSSTISNVLGNVFDSLQSDAKNNIPGILNASSVMSGNLLDSSASAGSSSLWNPSFNGIAEALIATEQSHLASNFCGRVNIMGTIVQDASPYLFPFIIEYSLIGAAVIYVMWKHIGRCPRWPHQAEADLERRLEAMLSRRAVALAQAGNGRMDCVGASKGLFFGLLLLVGALICLILFFVLIHHPDLGLLAIYLADASHCALMALSIVAIIIGFIRVQNLKFKAEEQSDLNDILLRVSAFGLFIYSVFSVIAGALAAFTHEPNLLVMVTGILAVVQVLLQLLFIADVSRRRVHLPEHDRSKPGRQIVTFLLIVNVAMWIIYTFEAQKVAADPVQIDFYGYLPWALVQRFTLPLCIFHRFHSAVTLAEIWKCSYKARLE